MKKLTCAALTLFFGCVHADEGPMIGSYSERDLLKNWALSTCFATIANDAETKADAHATAGGYFEFCERSIESFDRIRLLVNKFVQRKYSGGDVHVTAEYNTAKCIDLFHSKELNDLVSGILEPKKTSPPSKRHAKQPRGTSP